MPTEQKMLYCPYCKKNTLHIQQTPNHVLHLLMAIITLGLWLIVWGIINATQPLPTCTGCGFTKKTAPIRQNNQTRWIFTDKKIMIGIIVTIFVAAFIGSGNESPKPTTTTNKTPKPGVPSSALPVEARQKYLDAFVKAPEDVLKRLNAAIDRKEWDQALTISEYYLPTQQPELMRLNAIATAGKKNALISVNQPITAPFLNPTQYIGLSLKDAEKAIGIKANNAGNIVAESPIAHMQVSMNGSNEISYIQIELLRKNNCSQNEGFNSIPMLAMVGIDPRKLTLVKKQTHFHTFYDHSKKLKIFVTCTADGMPYSIGISKNYYLQ